MDQEQQGQEQGTVPTSAADATEEVNQQQVADQQEAQEHPQGVQPAEPLRVPDERVPSDPGNMNPVVGADQPVTDPAQPGPDQNELRPDVEPNPEPETEPSH